jgi:hypothetical protein
MALFSFGEIMPRISKINDDTTNISGTSFVGEIVADYNLLVEKLGEPGDSFDNYKTDAEWVIEFEGGEVATIYNWKDGVNYCGESGTPVELIKEWHIGGRSSLIQFWIEDYLFNSWPVFDEIRQDAQF